MNSLDNIEEKSSKEEYNKIPVTYCKKCLSLKIMILNDDVDYCDDCGCTDLATTDIESWKEMCEKKYGKTFNK